MLQIGTVTLTDEQIDLLVGPAWTPTVLLKSDYGKVERPNISKAEFAQNIILDYVNDMMRRQAKNNADALIRQEMDKVPALTTTYRDKLTAEEKEALAAEKSQ